MLPISLSCGAAESAAYFRRQWFVDVVALKHNYTMLLRNNSKRRTSSSFRNNYYAFSSMEDHINYLTSQKATPLSLSTMYKYATANNESSPSHQRLANAQFLHRELQIRIAHRLVDLKTLPLISDTSHILDVCEKYREYLVKLRHFPSPKTRTDEANFTDMLQQFVLDRHTVTSAIHEGLVSNLKNSSTLLSSGVFNEGILDELEFLIQKFMMARVGLRFLTEHHVLCSPDIDVDAFRRQQGYLQNDDTNDDGHPPSTSKGAISTSVDPGREAKLVARQVMNDCKMSFGVSPEIHVVDCSGSCTFTYVPHHLHYMLAELLKNSCRAVLKKHWKPYIGNNKRILTSLQRSALDMIPPVQVVIAKGDEDITIKISDRGGGIPRSTCDKMWTFVHSTLVAEGDDNDREECTSSALDFRSSDASTNFDKNAFTNHVHGRSFGLPLARIYAQYLGGELTIRSMEGVGVDAYLYVPVLGVECEHLPDRVSHSPGNLDSSLDNFSTTSEGGKSIASTSPPWTHDNDLSKNTVVLT
jgi:pyruvate dehydrogenase kinase 2/3/4